VTESECTFINGLLARYSDYIMRAVKGLRHPATA